MNNNNTKKIAERFKTAQEFMLERYIITML